jgi:hypothetical protein
MNIEDLLTVENLQPIINLKNEISKAKLEFYTELAQAEMDLYRIQTEIYQARINYESRKLTTTTTEPNQTRNRTQ